MLKHFLDKTVNNTKGFSLLEVLLGVTVFMIGMLGVTALNISSLKSNTFSGNMSEATELAAGKIEELMVLDFDDADELKDLDGDGNGAVQDGNNNGIDDDDEGTSVDDWPNFGLDDVGTGGAPDRSDNWDLGVGKNGMYDIYWNVAEGEPLPDNTKRVNVFVEWQMKLVTRRINIETVILKTD